MRIPKVGFIILAATTVAGAPAAAAGAAATSAPPTKAATTGTAAITKVRVTQPWAVYDSFRYPIEIQWTNSAAVAYTDIYRYFADFPTTRPYLGRTTSTHWYTPLSDDDSTFYLLKPYDANGNPLPGGGTNLLFPFVTDDFYVSYSSGTWYTTTLKGAVGGGYSYSSSPGATATFNTFCDDFNLGLVATTSPAGGTADIIIGGAVVRKISFHSNTLKTRVLLWKTRFSHVGQTSKGCVVKLVQTSGQVNVDAWQEIHNDI